MEGGVGLCGLKAVHQVERPNGSTAAQQRVRGAASGYLTAHTRRTEQGHKLKTNVAAAGINSRSTSGWVFKISAPCVAQVACSLRAKLGSRRCLRTLHHQTKAATLQPPTHWTALPGRDGLRQVGPNVPNGQLKVALLEVGVQVTIVFEL